MKPSKQNNLLSRTPKASFIVSKIVVRFLFFVISLALILQTSFQVIGLWGHLATRVDFTAFYSTARLSRLSPLDSYNLDRQQQDQTTLAAEYDYPAGLLPFLYPPFFLWLLVPITYFTLPNAYVLWGILQLLLLIAGFIILLKASRPTAGRRLDIWLVFTASFPVYAVWYQGQSTGLIFISLASFLYWYQQQRLSLAGLSLSLLALKPQFALLWWLYPLAKRNWPVLKWAIIGSLGLLGLSIIWPGPATLIQYANLLVNLDPAQVTDMDVERSYNLRGLIELVELAHKNWIWLSIYLLVGGGIIYFLRLTPPPPAKSLAQQIPSLVVLSLYLSPLLHIHDLSLFLLALPWLASIVSDKLWLIINLAYVFIPFISLILGSSTFIKSNLWFQLFLIPALVYIVLMTKHTRGR